ncbi:MAG: hypothetical protein Q8936_02315 [Bacillota bacterium]|nr:hypothetical protein [Bacillota bacterium]
MEIRELMPEEEGIGIIRYELTKEKFSIRWDWPKDKELVYIFKIKGIDEISIDELFHLKPKLYTKDEYKEFNGYVEQIEEINQYTFYIFSASEDEEEIVLVKQDDGKNRITLSTGKPNILYEIDEKKAIFSKVKTVTITIRPDINIKKEVLCYVKKEGAYPQSVEDGVKFDFVSDFRAGTNVMPSISIKKNEFIKVFFKDPMKYGNAYNLMQK